MRTEPRRFNISDLVREFNEGKITLPLMQRDFVWRPRKARALFESLCMGYPIGSFYLWKSVKPQLTKQGHRPGSLLLLDGQQRLTSLIRGIAPEGGADQAYRAYLDLINDSIVMGEETVTVKKRIAANDPTLIALSEIISIKEQSEVERLKVVQNILQGLRDENIIRKEHAGRAMNYQARVAAKSKLFERTVPCEEV